jgi:hypothetical protein
MTLDFLYEIIELFVARLMQNMQYLLIQLKSIANNTII